MLDVVPRDSSSGQSFKSLAVMRAIQGIAAAPLETLVTASVADLYFVHQRGSRLAIWGTMLGKYPFCMDWV
jgi:MFS family permease